MADAGQVRGRRTQNDSAGDRTGMVRMPIGGAYWRHPANTTELSVCGGSGALCQITLITCLSWEHAEERRTAVKLMRKDGPDPYTRETVKSFK